MSHEHENLIISLMEARKKGKTIQYCDFRDQWHDFEDDDYSFSPQYKYRIKPDEPREFLLAKWKEEVDSCDNYWVASSGKKYPTDNYDYIRVREILED